MLTCRVFREGRPDRDAVPLDRVPDLLAEEGTLLWVDGEVPTGEEIARIADAFELHPLAVEDARKRGQRAKVDVYDRFVFVVAHGVRWDGGAPVDQEIHAVVGSRFLVTLRHDPAFDLSPVVERWARRPDLMEGPGYPLYVLLDEVVDGYFDALERMEDAAEDIEEGVFADEPEEGIQERIFRLKKQVIGFRRLAMPLREVLDLLEELPWLVGDPLRAYYRDVADHLIRSLEFLDNLRDLLSTALEAYLSQVGNRLNVIMKKLTSWAAIILIPTLIAGIYGMNFRFMPELDWRLGYPFALGLMVGAAGVLYLVFKRRGWL